MKAFWNSRYAQEGFAYGKEPNRFFEQELLKLSSGKILLPAEGEGRNAVFAAKNNWEVTAFDSSLEAKTKAECFASESNVKFDYQINDFEDIQFDENYFDVIALIYAHTSQREKYHKKLIQFLKPGGIILLEGFSKKQIGNNTGGPKNIDMLFSKENLSHDFKILSELNIWEKDIVLNEGVYHVGESSVIRFIGKK